MVMKGLFLVGLLFVSVACHATDFIYEPGFVELNLISGVNSDGSSIYLHKYDKEKDLIFDIKLKVENVLAVRINSMDNGFYPFLFLDLTDSSSKMRIIVTSRKLHFRGPIKKLRLRVDLFFSGNKKHRSFYSFNLTK